MGFRVYFLALSREFGNIIHKPSKYDIFPYSLLSPSKYRVPSGAQGQAKKPKMAEPAKSSELLIKEKGSLMGLGDEVFGFEFRVWGLGIWTVFGVCWG